MKTIIYTLLFISIYSHVTAQTVSQADSLEIANKVEDWNKGWKTKDHKLATKWYSNKAEFTNAFGHNKVGQQEIEKLLGEVFQLPFVMAGDSKVARQKFIALDDNVVLVITSIERAGQKTADNKELGVRQTTHHRIFRKENEWLIIGHLISDARETKSDKH